MSNNQKQTPSVVSQNQPRYPQGPFIQQRSDGYHVATPPAYVQQPPLNQGNNQVPPLRGMPPTGPPNQASTPPNTDLKVQQMPPQQQSMNIYVSQMSRGPAQNMYVRAPQPSTQSARMANHRQGQHNMFQTQPPFVQLMQSPAAVPYINTQASYYNGGPRAQPFVAPFQMIPSTAYSYPPAQTQPQAYFYGTPSIIQRPQLQTLSVQQTPAQPTPAAMSLPPAPQLLNTRGRHRREHALSIIDPATGVDIFEQDDSHIASGESSARQTPQPPISNTSKEVQADFARQVTEAIKDKEIPVIEDFDSTPVMDPVAHMYSLPPQAIPHQRFDSIVQSSKLQVATKEFVPASLNNTAKETTPVVSAITDAEEVTITNKPKDRESPIKSRKQKEQSNIVKEPVIIKEKEDVTICEKPVGVTLDEIKPKDTLANDIAPSKEPAILSEKKAIKKEVSSKPPVPTTPVAVVEEPKQENEEVVPDAVPIVDTVASHAKTKQPTTATKIKELPKQSPQAPPQPHSQPHVTTTTPQTPVSQKVIQPVVPSVPLTQPTKPNNKTSKMREINLKGALKEGTDMDAFNDNKTQENNKTNTDYVNSDYVNYDNSTMLNNNEDTNKNNDITTIKPIIESKPKSKFDVMDIVKDTPKPIKPISIPPPVESPDEVDRAVLANEKLVQAKNEANAKASIDIIDTNPPEEKINLPYKDGQWSPMNQDGKKVYGYDFLMALKDYPKSKAKPQINIPTDIIANDPKARAADINRYPSGGRQNDFAPNFGNNAYANKNSQRGALVKRKSQQGPSNNSSIKAGNRPSIIRVSISVKEDVKLREVENAWRPARCVHGENMTEDDKKTAELYKKVRGVLNKLTPQKFSQLLDQVRTFNIDTSERLQGVIDLVFEKAVDEPNFSVAYANLCKELSMMQVPIGDTKKKEGQPPEFVNFRKLLVTRCQLEFEKNSIDETERNEKLNEIKLCDNDEKKKDMLLELEEYDRRTRMKSVGNIRFIGELFKQNMLTTNIMLRCFDNLLRTKDEESLECLCKLMSTVGKELESRNLDLNYMFSNLKELVDKKNPEKISSRVRFMIQDVIDLRQSHWVPRRQDFNPKTMDQIQKDAENEHSVIQALNAVPVTPRKDDRLTSGGSGSMHSERKNRRNMGSDEGGWQTTQNRNSRNTPFNFAPEKLKISTPMNDEPLGNYGMYSTWGAGAGANVKPSVTSSNMYATLELLDSDKRPTTMSMRQHGKDNYNSKGPSLDRSYRQSYGEGRGSRSGSQHRSRDSSVSHHGIQQNSIPPMPNAPIPTTVAPRDQQASIPPTAVLTPEQLETHVKTILEDYLIDNDINICDNDIKRLLPPSELPKLVIVGSNNVLERSKSSRLGTGQFFARLIKLGTLTIEDYCIGLTEILSSASDLIIDIPKLWDYLAEIIGPVSCESALNMRDLHKCCEKLISQNYGGKLLISIFNFIIQEKGPNFLHSIWNSSGLALSKFMPNTDVDSFIKDNKFECLLQIDSNASYRPNSSLSQQDIHRKLVAAFEADTSFDEIVNWITANVGEGVKELPFIRTLTTACCEDLIVQNNYNKCEIVKNRFSLILRYVEHSPESELQCLYALHALINKLEHPKGVLLNIFNRMYEDNIISHEGFLAWEQSNDPAELEGKGVSLMQLTSFFTQLKEVDDEDSSEETAG